MIKIQGRYRFVDWFGMPRGIRDTNNLQEAKELAIGIIWNGNPAIVMLKEDWLNLRNPEIREQKREE